MSGVFWCCCEEPTPPQICPCYHVCNNAWIFTDGIGAPSDAGYVGSLYTTEKWIGVSRDEPFTLLFWLNWCNDHGQQGHIWNTYEEVQPYPNVPTVREWFAIDANFNPDCDAVVGTPGFSIKASFRLSNELGDFWDWQVDLCMKDGLPSDFKMVTIQYMQVPDGFGRQVPRVNMKFRYVDIAVQTLEVEEDFDAEARELPGNSWGLQIPDGMQTYVGAHVGPCDPYFDPNFDPYDGCLENLTIYKEYLNDTQYEEKWNDGNGLLDSEAWERWCPTTNFCTEKQVGAIRGEVLWPRCPIKDQNGNNVEDEIDLCIYGDIGP